MISLRILDRRREDAFGFASGSTTEESMPKGNPSTETLSASLIRAFSLDTSVIEAASFRFDQGALRLLALQLPPWMELWISTIVEKEISSHRMASVKRSLQEVETGMAGLRRHIGPEFNPGSVAWMRGVFDIVLPARNLIVSSNVFLRLITVGL